MLGTGLGFALLTADAADAEGIDFANFSVATEKTLSKICSANLGATNPLAIAADADAEFSRRHSRLVSTTTTLTAS